MENKNELMALTKALASTMALANSQEQTLIIIIQGLCKGATDILYRGVECLGEKGPETAINVGQIGVHNPDKRILPYCVYQRGECFVLEATEIDQYDSDYEVGPIYYVLYCGGGVYTPPPQGY